MIRSLFRTKVSINFFDMLLLHFFSPEAAAGKKGVLKACKIFPVKFVKFLSTPILKNFCERLLLFSLAPSCFTSLALLKLPLKNQISVRHLQDAVKHLCIMVPKEILDYQSNYYRNFVLFQENIHTFCESI